MSPTDLVFHFDILGSIAFAFSGAMVPIRKKLDLFGVLTLAVVTAVGGGIMRDLLAGNHPPVALTNMLPIAIALSCGVITFIFFTHIKSFKKLIAILDALGLGIFTLAGVQVGEGAGLNNWACIFLGVLTGIGGGVLRDILADRIPYVLRKELYAAPALLGAGCYFLLKEFLRVDLASHLAIGLIIVLRILAIQFNWRLPRRLGRNR